MGWVDRMNRAVDYLEDHLTGEIDPDEVSRIAVCPYSVFQRSFGPLAGMPLAEYLRRRRLSRAAGELQTTDRRVLDIAVRYGYESADAFTVAFKRMHGVTPKQARRTGVALKYQARLSFALTVSGVTELAYRVVEREEFGVLGVRRTTPQGGGTWALVKAGRMAENLQQISGHPANLGLCFGFDQEGNNDYLCGAEWDGPAVAGLDLYRCPASAWLVFTAEGRITERALESAWRRVYGEFLPHREYIPRDLPTIERYLEWDEDADRCRVEIVVPVTAGGRGC
ncbi:MAG: helix-turn-helix domain-containing protein [Propionicimonas sp.]